MSSFGFLLIQNSPQNLVIDKTFNAVVEQQEILVQLEIKGGILKSKKSKFQKTILKAMRGDYEAFRFKVTLDDVPYNLSGYTLVATGRIHPDAPAALFTVGIANNVNGNDHVNGIVVLTLNSLITTGLPTTCSFDIQATQGATVTTLVSGEIQTDPDVTRP
jgi:hypothetical protein